MTITAALLRDEQDEEARDQHLVYLNKEGQCYLHFLLVVLIEEPLDDPMLVGVVGDLARAC